MKSLYCIAGILPAQFRTSQVDCGIGWKEHSKKKPRKGKKVIEYDDSIESGTICTQAYLDRFAQVRERQPSIDLSTIKPGDKVMLVDGETFKYGWARDFTKNKVYVVCEVDMEDTEGMQIRLIDDIGDTVWVFTADVRQIGFNPATKTWTVDDMSKLDCTKVKVGDKLVFADTEANRQHAPYGTQVGLIYTVHAFEEDRLLLCWDEL